MTPHSETPANLSPANILVVDDDAINLMVIEQMLDCTGFPVASAVDGLDAVEKAARLHPSLVLMDISMPRMNGIDAAIAIRQQSGTHCPKIVAVTANVTDRQREACKSAGFDGFIAKPIDMNTLLTKIGEFIA
jgi:CheY-like chemotaxis protein